jgi:hypothetical protein
MKKAREEAERERDEMVQREKDKEKRANAARYKEGVREYSKEAVNTPPSSMLGKASKFVRTKIGDPFERTFGPDKYAEGPDAGQLRARREYLGYKKGGMMKSNMADKAGRAMKKRTPDTMGRAMVKKMAGGGMAYSGGGSVYRKAAGGIESKGKTRGKMVKMAGGGKC